MHHVPVILLFTFLFYFLFISLHLFCSTLDDHLSTTNSSCGMKDDQNSQVGVTVNVLQSPLICPPVCHIHCTSVLAFKESTTFWLAMG